MIGHKMWSVAEGSLWFRIFLHAGVNYAYGPLCHIWSSELMIFVSSTCPVLMTLITRPYTLLLEAAFFCFYSVLEGRNGSANILSGSIKAGKSKRLHRWCCCHPASQNPNPECRLTRTAAAIGCLCLFSVYSKSESQGGLSRVICYSSVAGSLCISG